MTELIKNPAVMTKAQTEIRQAASDNTNFDKNTLSYLQLVIKETLRMHPPGPLLVPRLCKESCQVLGYTIPCGAKMAHAGPQSGCGGGMEGSWRGHGGAPMLVLQLSDIVQLTKARILHKSVSFYPPVYPALSHK